MNEVISFFIAATIVLTGAFTFSTTNDRIKSTKAITIAMLCALAVVFFVNYANDPSWLDLATAAATGAAGFFAGRLRERGDR
jgi:peptidoglycan/LPS O-acetylase OafA/YrhL